MPPKQPSRLPRSNAPDHSDNSITRFDAVNNHQLFKPREFSEDPHYAITLNDVKLLRKHLKRDPQIVFSRNDRGSTLLHFAAHDDDPKFVTCLLEEGAPVDIEDAGGFTPLYGAVMSGKLATAMRIHSVAFPKPPCEHEPRIA